MTVASEDKPGDPLRRKRRPWWRWNLTTLAAVLFVTVWSRELLNWHYATTWIAAASVLSVWFVGPLPFVEHERLKRMPPSVLRTRSMLSRTRPPLLVRWLRFVGASIFVLGSLQFLLTAGWWIINVTSGQAPFNFGRNPLYLLQFGSVASASIMPALGGGVLYLLAVLTERLWDLGLPAKSTQAAESTRSID